LTLEICASLNAADDLARLTGERVAARTAFGALARGALFPGDFFAGFALFVAFFAPTFLLDTGFFLDPFLATDSFDDFPFEAPFFFPPFEILAFLDEVFFGEVFFVDIRFLRVFAAEDLRDPPVAAFFLLPSFFLLLAGALFLGMRSAPSRPNEVGDYTCADRQRKPLKSAVEPG
jgi:hypothetical protein